MRTQNEIKQRIAEIEDEIRMAKEWVNKAREEYTKSIKLFGVDESDRGELEYAQDTLRELGERKETLEWVLGKDL